MLVLVGLGNPGAKYARHRHNVGFMAVDAIAEAHGFDSPRSKFNAEIRDGWLSGPDGREKTLIVKPQTYMNESGRAVGEIVRFYKLDPSDIVVFYDELDLAAGKVRAKTGGGAAGHNGIRSIDAHIGNDFRRIRIGIGHPGDRSKVTGHVLGDFAKADAAWLDPLLEAMAASAPSVLIDEKRFASDVAAKLNVQGGRDKPNRGGASPGKEKTTAAPKNEPKTCAGNGKPGNDKSAEGPLAAALQKIFGKSDS